MSPPISGDVVGHVHAPEDTARFNKRPLILGWLVRRPGLERRWLALARYPRWMDGVTQNSAGSDTTSGSGAPGVSDLDGAMVKRPGDRGSTASSPRSARIVAVGAVLGLALIITQVVMLTSLNDTKAELGVLREQVGQLGDEISAIGANVEGLALTSDNASPTELPSGTAPAGYLPRFDRNIPDQALGMTLGSIDGVDGYTAESVSIDPGDGVRRIWMIWAHWCPYCQQEIPLLSEWYPGVADQYEGELVTVSTNIDPSRGNPLEEYLAEGQFPFPVIVDPTNDLAVKMGVSAFPFWIITDGDGVVLFRATGLLDVVQVENLFTQLEAFGT